MLVADDVRRMIECGLACDRVVIESADGVHFTGLVVSSQFERLTRVRQHQAVYATLGKMMGNEIHALQLQTFTPAQWRAEQGTE